MVPDGLSIALAVAAGCVVGVVFLGLAWALCEELAYSTRSGGRATLRRKRGALICLDGGGHVVAGDVLERAAARRIRLRAVSRDDPDGHLRTSRVLRLVVTTSSAESPARTRPHRGGVRRRATTDAVHQSLIGPIGLRPVAG